MTTTTYTPTTCGRFVPSDVEPDACERCSDWRDAHALDRVMFRLCRYRDRLTELRDSVINVESREWLAAVGADLDQIIEEFRD